MASTEAISLDRRSDNGKLVGVSLMINSMKDPLFVVLWWGLAYAVATWVPATAKGETTIERGAYLTAASGCVTCHTDAKAKNPPFAGGGPMKTPFGTFYAPNITPHLEYGIGSWSEANFARALREGISPGGHHYFPAFPYTSYTNMTLEDARNIKAYLFSLVPVAQQNRAHDIKFPFGWRFAQTLWKLLFFKPGPLQIKTYYPPGQKRGTYLVRALVHCAECHTPRNLLGGMDWTRWLAGTPNGVQGDAAPNITPDEVTGLGRWSAEELVEYLETGMKPDGDFAGASMAEIIDHSTSKLSTGDRAAIAAYLRSVPAIRSWKSLSR